MTVRQIELARSAWGVALLASPDQVVGLVARTETDRRGQIVGLVLGARHLTHAVLSGVLGVAPGGSVLLARCRSARLRAGVSGR